MRPRPVAYVLAVAACVLGASLAAALSPGPTLPGMGAPASAPGKSAPAGNDTDDNETRPPRNETQPPRNETRPPNGTRNETLPPPQVSPENQTLTGRAGAEVRFEVVVRNTASQTQVVGIDLDAPATWRTRVDAFDGSLAPGESVTVTGSISALGLYPTHAVVSVEAIGRDASSFAFLDVCFVTPLVEPCLHHDPPGNETRPPRNETQPPRNETGGNNTKPPRNETGGGNETRDPPGNETGEPRSAPAAAPAVRVLRVEEPALVSVRVEASLGAPGGPPALSGEGVLRLL